MFTSTVCRSSPYSTDAMEPVTMYPSSASFNLRAKMDSGSSSSIKGQTPHLLCDLPFRPFGMLQAQASPFQPAPRAHEFQREFEPSLGREFPESLDLLGM